MSNWIRFVSTGTLSWFVEDCESGWQTASVGSSSGFGCINIKGSSATRSLKLNNQDLL